MEYILKKDFGTILRVYIRPGSNCNQIVGEYGNPLRLKIKIKSPPVDGKANEQLQIYLSKLLKISKNKITLLRGESSRQKDLFIEMPIDELIAKIKVIKSGQKH